MRVYDLYVNDFPVVFVALERTAAVLLLSVRHVYVCLVRVFRRKSPDDDTYRVLFWIAGVTVEEKKAQQTIGK